MRPQSYRSERVRRPLLTYAFEKEGVIAVLFVTLLFSFQLSDSTAFVFLSSRSTLLVGKLRSNLKDCALQHCRCEFLFQKHQDIWVFCNLHQLFRGSCQSTDAILSLRFKFEGKLVSDFCACLWLIDCQKVAENFIPSTTRGDKTKEPAVLVPVSA
jgi:hypothetical protein